MKALKVLKCSDSSMWYRNKIGQTIPLVHPQIDYDFTRGPMYWSREDAGYKNIVMVSDVEIVEVDNELQTNVGQAARA